jgi:hypothetical protein
MPTQQRALERSTQRTIVPQVSQRNCQPTSTGTRTCVEPVPVRAGISTALFAERANLNGAADSAGTMARAVPRESHRPSPRSSASVYRALESPPRPVKLGYARAHPPGAARVRRPKAIPPSGPRTRVRPGMSDACGPGEVGAGRSAARPLDGRARDWGDVRGDQTKRIFRRPDPSRALRVRPWDGSALESVGDPPAGCASEGRTQETRSPRDGPALAATAMAPDGQPSSLGGSHHSLRPRGWRQVLPSPLLEGAKGRAWGRGTGR